MHSQVKKLNLLLIEDNSGDARLFEEYLKEVPDFSFSLTHVTRLAEGIQMLEEQKFDIALIDLGLPDSHGMATVTTIKENEIDLPMIVLSGMDDEFIAIEAVKEGAQDYLVKNRVTGELLVRAIRYAIQRFELIREIKRQSVMDDLTSLYNRRGFNVLSQQQIKVSKRIKKGFCLLYIDVDHMKEINDTYGHLEGDKAINTAANILKDTFSDGDILARLGGDEFAVISIDITSENAEDILLRMNKTVESYNATNSGDYSISLSSGYSFYYPDQPNTIEDLLIKADNDMYQNKALKRNDTIVESNHLHLQLETLSKREKEVFEQLLKGIGNQEIGELLFISSHTVKNHVSKIFTKLNVSDRHQLLYQYYKS